MRAEVSNDRRLLQCHLAAVVESSAESCGTKRQAVLLSGTLRLPCASMSHIFVALVPAYIELHDFLS